MSEWPPASRLTDALNDAETTMSPDEDAWRNLQDDLERPLMSVAQSAAPDRWLGKRALAAVGAAAVAVVALLIAALGSDGRNQEELETAVADQTPTAETAAGPTTEPIMVSPTAPPPAADRFSDAFTCGPGQLPLRRYGVGAAGANAVVAGRGELAGVLQNPPIPASVWQYYVADSIAFVDGATAELQPLDNELVVVADPTNLADWESVRTDIAAAVQCRSALRFLVTSGAQLTSVPDAVCTPLRPGTGWDGAAHIDTQLSPETGCVRGVTFLIDQLSAQDPTIQEWVTSYGCAGPSSRLDTEGNRITEWAQCDVTLLHVQTNGPPADATIDGMALPDFIRLLRFTA